MEGVSPSSSSNSPYASLQDLSPKWAQTRSRLISFPNLHYYHHQDPVRSSVSFRASLSLSLLSLHAGCPRNVLMEANAVAEFDVWPWNWKWVKTLSISCYKKKNPLDGAWLSLHVVSRHLLFNPVLPAPPTGETQHWRKKKRDYLDVWLCWETSVHRTVSSPSADVVRKDLTYCFFLALVVVMYIWTCQVSYIVLSSALRVSVDNWSTTAQAFKERELFVSWGTTV